MILFVQHGDNLPLNKGPSSQGRPGRGSVVKAARANLMLVARLPVCPGLTRGLGLASRRDPPGQAPRPHAPKPPPVGSGWEADAETARTWPGRGPQVPVPRSA